MLASILPAPKHNLPNQNQGNIVTFGDKNGLAPSISVSNSTIPLYPHRQGYIPIEVSDFGDGGAFPEIHMVQYPLNMGRPGHKSSTALVAVQVDESGKFRSDAIVRQGGNKNKIIQSQMSDIKEKKGDKDKLDLPNEAEELSTAERTKAALEALVEGKIKSSKPSTVVNTNEIAEPTYIRYAPNPDAPGYNPAAKQRVIKMVEAQVDPMEPPKHKHMKVPRGPPSPPVPVLHSPPRKLTVADQQAWKIPPCVSNWKNAKGFIIPLDKRLAADGRGLQEVTINNKFAMLSEALYISERKATEDLKIRNQIKKKMALKEKEDKEEALREMANRARMERSGILKDDGRPEESYYGPGSSRGKGAILQNSAASDDDDNEEDIDGFEGETEEEKIARQQRERIRMDRRKERERELRLENMKGNNRKNKIDRDEGRDISEKIALGMLKGNGKLGGESLYDSRLFNQSAGMDAGFGGEDEYNTYTKPLFDRGESSSIYRPKKSDDDVYGDADAQLAKLSDTSRFKPDKGFKGAEGGNRGGPRDAPVQFERPSEDDPFGIGDIVKDTQSNKRIRKEY
eukprot:gene6652-9133_t